MTQEREALKLALEFIERVNKDGWILADFEDQMYEVITAIKEVLAQPDQYAKGNWINAEDVSRNVKALDIALNGEGAASSPLLIDVLGQVQAEARRIGKPVLKALAQQEPPPECPMDSYGDGNVYRGQRSRDSVVKTITLAQQEPVAWLSKGGKGIWFHEPDASLNATPLYTTPPQRKPLTDEEIMNIAKVSCIGISPHEDTLNFAKVIEAAHGIKE